VVGETSTVEEPDVIGFVKWNSTYIIRLLKKGPKSSRITTCIIQDNLKDIKDANSTSIS